MDILRRIGFQEHKINQYANDHPHIFTKYNQARIASAPNPGEKYAKDTYPITRTTHCYPPHTTYYSPADGFHIEFMTDIIKFHDDPCIKTIPLHTLLSDHIGFTDERTNHFIKILQRDNLFLDPDNTIKGEIDLHQNDPDLYAPVDNMIYVLLDENFRTSCYSLPPEATTFLNAIEDCPEDSILRWDGNQLHDISE